MEKRGRAPKSILGVEVAVTGDVDADARIQVDGTIEGDIRGTLVEISRGAVVRGSIFAAEAVCVAGTVIGGIKAVTVKLTKHARLEGAVICETLQIESGADIEARFSMSRSESTTDRESKVEEPAETDQSDPLIGEPSVDDA